MITHEQAAVIRSIDAADDELLRNGLLERCFDGDGHYYRVTKSGSEALAEFDAETKRLLSAARLRSCLSILGGFVLDELSQHVGAGDSRTGKHTIIETSELHRLQALERKIKAFFSPSHILPVELHGPEGWLKFKCNAVEIGKVFELFEAPGDEA